jgi:hypothetical protein
LARGVSQLTDHRQMIVRLDREQRAIERQYQSQGRAFARLIRLHAIAAARIGGDIEQAVHDVIYGDQIEQPGISGFIRTILLISYLFGRRRAILENDKLTPPKVPSRDDFESDSDWLRAWMPDDFQWPAVGSLVGQTEADLYGNIAASLRRHRYIDELADTPKERITRMAMSAAGFKGDENDSWAIPQMITLLVGLGYSGGLRIGFDEQDDVVAYRYSTMRDTRVRENHAKMEGVIRRKGDPVWLKWTPPCGWGCRCWRLPIFAGTNFTETSELPNVEPDQGWDSSLRI